MPTGQMGPLGHIRRIKMYQPSGNAQPSGRILRWIKGESAPWYRFYLNIGERIWRSDDTGASYTDDYLNNEAYFVEQRQFNDEYNSPMRRAADQLIRRGPSVTTTSYVRQDHPLKGPDAIETRVYCVDCIQVYSLHNNDKCPNCGSLKYKLRENGLDIFNHRADDVTISNTNSSLTGRPTARNDWHLIQNGNTFGYVYNGSDRPEVGPGVITSGYSSPVIGSASNSNPPVFAGGFSTTYTTPTPDSAPLTMASLDRAVDQLTRVEDPREAQMREDEARASNSD